MIFCTHRGLGPEQEDVSNEGEELLGGGGGVLEPCGAVQVHILDQQRVEGIDVSHQDAERLQWRKY